MKKRLLPALLALVMVLGMLPLSVFAAAEGAPEVAGYGFLWKDIDEMSEEPTLAGSGTAGSDWMGQTMYVVFKEAPAQSTNLWFEVEVTDGNSGNGSGAWGCVGEGNGKHKTFAFSFLNNVTNPLQWEYKPSAITDAGLTTGAKATLKVYTGTTIKGGTVLQAAPEANTKGTLIFTSGEMTFGENSVVGESAPAAAAKVAAAYLNGGDAGNPAGGSEATKYEAAIANGAITLTAENLGKTQWGNPDASGSAVTGGISYVVGVGLPQTEKVKYAWDFGESVPADATYQEVTRAQGDTEKYTTFYFMKDTAEEWSSSQKGYISAKYDSGFVINYPITFAVTAKQQEEPATLKTVAATLDVSTKVAVGGDLPVAKITGITMSDDSKVTDAAEIAKLAAVETSWKNASDTVVTKAEAAGEYTYTVTFKDAEGNALEDVTATLNNGDTLTGTLTVEAGPEPGNTMTVTISGATLTSEELAILGGTAETDLGSVTSITADNANEKLLKAAGMAKYVELPKFNESVPDEQSGHYMAIKVEVAVTGATELPKTITLTNRSDGASNGKEIALTEDSGKASETIVVWLDGEGTLDGLGAKQFMVTVGEEKYIVDFTGVELEEKPEETVVPVEGTAGGTDEAPTVTVSADAVKTAAADAITAAKEANKDVDPDGEKVPVTIQITAPTGTDAEKVVSGSVAIPVSTINSLKTGNDPDASIDIPLAVEVPNVGSVTVAPESLEKIVGETDGETNVTIDVAKTEVPAVKDETLADTSVTEATHDSQAFKAEVKVDGTPVASTADAWADKEITLVFKIGANAAWDTSNIVVIHKAGANEEKITPTSYDKTTGELTVKVGHLSETIIYTPKTQTAESYTISFAAGDGTGSMSSATQTKASSGDTTYEISDNGFTVPAGKVFDGWTASVGTVAKNGDKYVLTIPESTGTDTAITLTAKWKTAPVTAPTWNAADKKGASDGSVNFAGLDKAKTYILKVTVGESELYSMLDVQDNGTAKVYCQAKATVEVRLGSSVVLEPVVANTLTAFGG